MRVNTHLKLIYEWYCWKLIYMWFVILVQHLSEPPFKFLDLNTSIIGNFRCLLLLRNLRNWFYRTDIYYWKEKVKQKWSNECLRVTAIFLLKFHRFIQNKRILLNEYIAFFECSGGVEWWYEKREMISAGCRCHVETTISRGIAWQ